MGSATSSVDLTAIISEPSVSALTDASDVVTDALVTGVLARVLAGVPAVFVSGTASALTVWMAVSVASSVATAEATFTDASSVTVAFVETVASVEDGISTSAICSD